jgi:hypothetical protein
VSPEALSANFPTENRPTPPCFANKNWGLAMAQLDGNRANPQGGPQEQKMVTPKRISKSVSGV